MTSHQSYFLAQLTDSCKLGTATAAPHRRRCVLIYEYEKQKWHAVDLKRRGKKQIAFMISTFVEIVF
jgi:hypothetical protein